MNAVAGGGSFVAFPALSFTGVPPIPANATNTLSQWVGTADSGGGYRNRLITPKRILIPLLLMSAALSADSRGLFCRSKPRRTLFSG
jgi:uncharacterized protein